MNGEGTEELIKCLFETLKTLPPVRRMEVDETFTYRINSNLDYQITMVDDAYLIEGTLVDMLCRNVALNDPDSMAYFQKILREKGVISQLKQMGINPRD
jgi:GTP-binding protein